MNVFRREFSFQLRYTLIWTIVLLLWALMFIPVTGQIMEEMDTIIQFFDKFPKALLRTFNMDAEMFSKPEGVFGSEGMSFAYILGGIFASLLAGRVFAREYEEKTIEYLLVKPLSRRSLFVQKALCMVLFLLFSGVLFGGSIQLLFRAFIGPKYTFSATVLLGFALYEIVVMLFFGAISALVSVIAQSTTLNTAISMALVIFMYFGSTLVDLNPALGWMRYASIFPYIPLIDTVKNEQVFWANSLWIAALSGVILLVALRVFEKKEIRI